MKYPYTNTIDDYAISKIIHFYLFKKILFRLHTSSNYTSNSIVSMVISYRDYDYTFVRLMSIVLIILFIFVPLIELFQTTKYLEEQKNLIIVKSLI